MLKLIKKFKITIFALSALLALTLFIVTDNMGVSYDVKSFTLTDLPKAAIAEKGEIKNAKKVSMILYNSKETEFDTYKEHIEQTLSIMRIGSTSLDVSSEKNLDFKSYNSVVLAFQELSALGGNLSKLIEYVNGGGKVLIFCVPSPSDEYNYLSKYIGVKEGGNNYTGVSGIKLDSEFMIGAKNFVYDWKHTIDTSLNVKLDKEKTTVYAESVDEESIPLVWSSDYGNGRWVCMNIDMAEKISRGFTAASYSLLDNVCIYPVINSSVFFIDDFPSPVPFGDYAPLRETYKRSIAQFYSDIWWPDMLDLSYKYNMKYTGLLIETYNDKIEGEFERQTDLERFEHFGHTLLDNGGQIGLHGYNHQSLCFTDFDYKGTVNYNKWKTEEDMKRALFELVDFSKQLYPDYDITEVYVPPSNLLSDKGRELLHKTFPNLRVISGLYTIEEIEYGQEFDIAYDGVVEFPRVISGTIVEGYERWAAINALNLHYVNSHFMHPDDVLDPERGADLGWEKMYEGFCEFNEWLYTSAPNLRNHVATDGGRATQRYDVLSVERQDYEDKINIRLHGFWDEAYLMLRLNDVQIKYVEGGVLEHVYGDFYTLRADKEIIDIYLKGE